MSFKSNNEPEFGNRENFKIPDVLMLHRLPFWLARQQTSDLSNFRDPDSIGILVKEHKLMPLGDPPPGAPLWFATNVVLALANKVKLLNKATRIVREHVQKKNKKTEAQREQE